MKLGKWFWGIFFIVSAAFVLLVQFFSFAEIGGWSLLFTIALALVFIASLTRAHFSGIFFSLAGIAIIYSEQLHIERLTPGPVLIAALFLTIGCSILFRRRWMPPHWGRKWRDNRNTVDTEGDSEGVSHGDSVNCSALFGSKTEYLHSPNLHYAELTSTFGGMKVYFDRAMLANNAATANLSCSFGVIELFIPHDWKVVERVNCAFGDISKKNRPGVLGSNVLTLTGNVNFGGVSIIYI